MTAHLTVDEVGTVRLYEGDRLLDTVVVAGSGRSEHVVEPAMQLPVSPSAFRCDCPDCDGFDAEADGLGGMRAAVWLLLPIFALGVAVALILLWLRWSS